jgi:hypothetical protein
MLGEINHIVVIQSLENERQTGEEIYNDCIKRQIEFRKSAITHRFFKANTKKQFIEVLRYCHANAPYMAGGIVLHLEMHGDADRKGLVLADHSLITWAELVGYFRPINISTCNKLSVSMATCNGRYLYLGVSPYEKSPYSCYISASTTVSSSEIVDQFSLLFERLVENGNLVNAYLDMEARGTSFYYKDSKTTFEEAFASAAEKLMTDPDVRAETIHLTQMETARQGVGMPPESSFDTIRMRALKDTYKRHRKAFDFSDCQ